MHTANDILARYADRLATRRVVCEPGLTPRMSGLLAEFLPDGKWLLLADGNTMPAAALRLCDALEEAGRDYQVAVLAPGGEELVCDAELVDRAAAELAGRSGPYSAVVAVGAGTICDAAKLAAERAGLPLAAVATAASMNGYPSVIAAVLRGGVKRTEPTTPPVLVLGDVDVLAAAPARLSAAGLADLLAKPVSTADWTLANALLGDELSPDGLGVVERSAELADALAVGVGNRDPIAIARLFEALFVSGLAMAVSGKSSPASGGEHLISHYLDMTALASSECGIRSAELEKDGPGSRCSIPNSEFPIPHSLHGLQVGVATLVTASLYRRLLDEFDPAALDIPARVADRRAWGETECELRRHFAGPLADSVIEQARQLHAEGDALAERLTRFRDAWGELKPKLESRLLPPEAVEAELKSAGAATTFAQIGVDRPRALAAVRFAHHVRARYTILHLLADLGLLEEWAADAVRPIGVSTR